MYQELIERVRPDWIIETGSANGGRALFLASICELLDHGQVVSIDPHVAENRAEHPRITYIEGQAQEPDTFARVQEIVGDAPHALVVLGSLPGTNLRIEGEFKVYGPLVPVDSYVIVENTIVNGHPVWPGFGPGPLEAVKRILAQHGEFVADTAMEKYGLTFNPMGFLKRVQASSGARLRVAGSGAQLDRALRGVLDVLERDVGNRAEIQAFVLRRLVGAAAQRDVLVVHLVPAEAARRRRAAVDLVERAFTEQHDELHVVELARPPVEVVIRQPAARQREALVEAAELLPHRLRHEQSVALAHRPEPTAGRRRRERRDREQPVAVVLPVELREQLVLDAAGRSPRPARPCAASGRCANRASRRSAARRAGGRATRAPASPGSRAARRR